MVNIKRTALVRVLILLSLLLIGSCEAKDNNSSSQRQKQANTVSQHDWLKEADLLLLKSGDLFEARKSVYNISMYKTDVSKSFIIDLWDGKVHPGLELSIDVISHPIVKLKIAQLLIQKRIENPEYFNYIKKYIDSSDLAIKTVAAEALRDVYSPEALNFLRKLTESDDEAIVDIALSGIKHQTIFGGNRDLASELWAEISKSSFVEKGLIQRYDRMYEEYFQNRESLKNQ